MKNRHRRGESADPNEKKDSACALLLSGAVHGALAAALVLNLSWKTESPEVYAELWAPEDISAGSDARGAARIEEKQTPEEPEKPDEAPEPKEPEEAVEPKSPAPEEIEEQARRAELEAAAEKARIEAEQARLREEARRLEEERLAKERARQEEIKRQQEEAIALEKQRQEEARRREAERLAQEKLAEERRKAEEAKRAEEQRKALEAQKKAEEEKRRAEEARKKAEEEKRRAEEARKKAEEEKRRAEEARRKAEEKKRREEARRRELARQEAERKRIAAETRKAELARLSAQIDASKNFSGSTSGDKSVSRQNLSGSSLAGYTARVIACIRPHIAIEISPDVRKGHYVAEFKLRMLPNGEPIGDAVQTKQSGLPAYDAAVARAIKRCNPFPRPAAGENLPKEIYLSFDPISDNNR